MKKLIFTLFVLFPFVSKAQIWDSKSFQLHKSSPSEYDLFHIELEGIDDGIHAWVTQGGFLFTTRNGDEYGYAIDAIFIYSGDTKESYYIRCHDILERKKGEMRGIEAEYSNIEIKDNSMVVIEVSRRDVIDGYIWFDTSNKHLDYKAMGRVQQDGI